MVQCGTRSSADSPITDDSNNMLNNQDGGSLRAVDWGVPFAPQSSAFPSTRYSGCTEGSITSQWTFTIRPEKENIVDLLLTKTLPPTTHTHTIHGLRTPSLGDFIDLNCMAN